MTDKTMVKLDEQELLTFVRRCLEWRNADVFAFGKHYSISRLGEIAGYISMMYDQDSNPRADSIRVVLPPAGGREPKHLLDDLHEGVRRAYRRFEQDDEKSAPFVSGTIAKIEVDHAADFTSESLSVLLERAKTRQVVIVGEARHYRLADLALVDNQSRLAEDIWCEHLHGVMLMAEERARATESYVILDIGDFLPSRQSNVELLKSAGDVGLCGGSHMDKLTPEEVISKVSVAYNHVAAGDVGKALSAIEKDDSLSDLPKWALRLAILEKAGVRDEVSRLLDESAETIAKLKSEDLLCVARIAAGVDRDDFTQDLIERALPDLAAATELEEALRIGLNTHRNALIQKLREQLRSLHPGSQLLRSIDGRSAAEKGDYATAADLLGKSPHPSERAIGSVFGLLADAVAGPGFTQPVVLGRELAAKMPDWTATIQCEILRSLERAGRRDDAVAMLFSRDIAWDEDWFVLARGLLERSLASGSKAVGPSAIWRLIEVAAAYIAEHPVHGYARTSVADLLDAERVGTSGIAILVKTAVDSADALSEVIKGNTSELAGLDDIKRLPGIMRRVLEWLVDEGDGMHLAGRRTMPVEVLGEDPDAVLIAILEMVDHYAVNANDPSDELLMRNFVAVALAIAPTAINLDGDFPVLRGAAVKLILGGRAQVARDLAEQILLVAGERPERRRKALTAFADIYTRIGRVREALLALIAAFKLPSEGTWEEIWSEQNILLRLLRDVGIPYEAIRVVERLRRVMAKVPNPDAYSSRLETLELNAQFHRSLTGSNDAWPTSRLLTVATANAEEVLTVGDEPLPAAMMLRQLIDRAEADGTTVAANAREVLARLTSSLPAAYQPLLAAAGRLPDASQIAAIAGPIQGARYNDDVSYDLRIVRIMARRLARASTTTVAHEGFAYAVELLGMQGVGVHCAGAEVKAAEKILVDVKLPLAAAVEIAGLGLPVVGMVLDETGLMVMTVTADGPEPPMAVETAMFDPEQFVNWSKEYPQRYCDPKLSIEEFRNATVRLGISDLPERALIVSGALSHLPPNVLTVNGDLAGVSRSLATAPSLAWLKASVAGTRKGDGTAAAWIPIAADGFYMDTLNLMAGELEGVLQHAGIPLHTQSATPAGLGSADLAIIGAHGGLAEDNKYFRGLSDDRNEPTDLRQLVDALRGSRVAILFVCSGGRVDRHPESGGLVGIAHELLDNGLDAVVAPSWPIPFTIARPWLDAFLGAWNSGSQIIDAYRAGNDAVAAATSHDLTRSLAMTLHGNPFIVR